LDLGPLRGGRRRTSREEGRLKMGREKRRERKGIGNGKMMWEGEKSDKGNRRSDTSFHGHSSRNPTSATGDVLIF